MKIEFTVTKLHFHEFKRSTVVIKQTLNVLFHQIECIIQADIRILSCCI